jgi:hypothetical protein
VDALAGEQLETPLRNLLGETTPISRTLKHPGPPSTIHAPVVVALDTLSQSRSAAPGPHEAGREAVRSGWCGASATMPSHPSEPVIQASSDQVCCAPDVLLEVAG